MKKETQQQELMNRFLEYTKQSDKITIYFIDDEVWIYKLGSYYNKLYNKIKNMNKYQIEEYFKPKYNYNFTEAC